MVVAVTATDATRPDKSQPIRAAFHFPPNLLDLRRRTSADAVLTGRADFETEEVWTGRICLLPGESKKNKK